MTLLALSLAATNAPPGVGPGLGAFLVVAGIAVATFFLMRSMRKHLGKINFDEKATERPERNTDNGPRRG